MISTIQIQFNNFPILFTGSSNLATKHTVMASSSSSSLKSDHIHHHQNNVVSLLSHRCRCSIDTVVSLLPHRCRCSINIAVSFLLLTVSVYIFWPSHPTISPIHVRLNRVRIHRVPHIAVDISLVMSVKVRNVDLYSMSYSTIHVAVAYRGKELGHVISDGGHVTAWSSSFVNALVEVNGVAVLFDVVYLLEDLAKGTVPFDTVTEVKGKLGIFFFKIPLEAKVSCQVHVNTKNQTIVKQNCYPEA